jgi:hypothetical protein
MQIIFVAQESFCAAPKPGARAVQPEIAKPTVGPNIWLRSEVDSRDSVERHSFILPVLEVPADNIDWDFKPPSASVAGGSGAAIAQTLRRISATAIAGTTPSSA